jgi:hypothetical protein
MIRITDRSTGKTVEAKGGKDAALIVGNALNRQWYERNIAAPTAQAEKRKRNATQAA